MEMRAIDDTGSNPRSLRGTLPAATTRLQRSTKGMSATGRCKEPSASSLNASPIVNLTFFAVGTSI